MSQERILLISDNVSINKAITEALSKRNYELTIASDTHVALEHIKTEYDAVILQYSLKGCVIQDFLRQLLAIDHQAVVTIVVEDKDIKVGSEFPQIGVFEIVLFPFNIEKFSFLIKTAVSLHSSFLSHKKVVLSLEERNASLQKQNILLAKRIEESTKSLTHLYDDLRSTYMRTIKSLVEAIDARDHYTCSHSQNVAHCAILIAEEMNLSLKEIENIRQACELHDVGKIGIDDRILTKPGPLNEEEWEQIKLHAIKGAQILEPLTFLEEVVTIVRQHHERYDGKGYPDGLKADEISLGARIISLADAYDVMTSVRTYRKEVLSKQEAVDEIKRNAGKQFDPKVVEVFLRIVDKL